MAGPSSPIMYSEEWYQQQDDEIRKTTAEIDRWDLILGIDSSKSADSLSTESTNNSNQPWKGFIVVFIGYGWGIKRSELERIAKQLGAKSFPSHVSKFTDRVVMSGWKGGKKLEEAQKLLDKDQIMDKLDFIFLAKEMGFVHQDADF